MQMEQDRVNDYLSFCDMEIYNKWQVNPQIFASVVWFG